MFKTKGLRKSIISAALLVAIITSWLLFAPIQSGGNAAYVILSGNSMSPKYWKGDLVILREKNHYQKGDIVAYQHPSIGYVFHRIIAVNPDGSFQLKGDHNDWVDSYMPTSDEIVGKFWLQIPQAGKTLQTLRSPWGFAILSLVFILLLYFSALPQKGKNNRGAMNSSSNQNAGEHLFILAALFLGALVLGISAFRQPVLNEISTPVAYEQQAIFRYTANVPSGIYDSTQVAPGEPIFRRLNGSFTLDMDYLFISTHPNNISGKYRLLARVSDGSGWKRTIELTPESTFSGNVFTTSGTLVLDDIQAFIDVLETETGIQRGRYALSIMTEIQIEGTLDGLPLSATFSPEIDFDVSELEVVLKGDSANADILKPVESAALMRKEYEANTISIFGMNLSVKAARWIALGLGLPSLFLLLISLGQIYRSSQENELERLKIWYGSRLIEARDPNLLTHSNRVEIASLDGLASLAEQDQRTILYLPDGEEQHLFVQTPEQLYHYEIKEQDHSNALGIDHSKANPFFTLPTRFQSRRTKNLQAAYEHALKGWAEAVDKRLSIEGQHNRIADMAYQLAQELGITGKELEDIRMAAYLHKIGLMNVPNEILEKKKKLTKQEMDILRAHPTYARENLNKTELLKPIAEAIYYQHERWDGTGQPEGLAGDAIPIGARIISVVNVWSGLSQARPYRKAWTQEEVSRYLREAAGKQFDPEILNIFLPKVLKLDTAIGDETLPAVIDAEEN